MLKVFGIRSPKWDLIIKVLFIVLFGGILYYQIFVEQNWQLLWDKFTDPGHKGRLYILILIFMLMPINWLLEALKWRVLLRNDMQISLSKAIRAVTTGLSFSMLTPNRMGEYFGRIAHVEAKHNWHAALSTLAGSISQNLINVIAGLFALLYVLQGEFASQSILYLGAWIAVSTFSLIAIGLYFRIDLLAVVIQRLKLPFLKERWLEKFNFFKTLENPQLGQALLLSALRYTVFCAQYVLMLSYFGVNLHVLELFAGVAVIYLMHTSIPLPPFIDQMARAQMALFLWANTGQNELSLLSAGFFIWIINVVMPALVGVISIGNVRLLKSFGYETRSAHPHTSAPRGDLDE